MWLLCADAPGWLCSIVWLTQNMQMLCMLQLQCWTVLAECQPVWSFTLPLFLPLPSSPSGSSSLACTCWLVIGLALCVCEFISGIFHLVFLNVIMPEEARQMRAERNSCSWLCTWCPCISPSARPWIMLVIKTYTHAQSKAISALTNYINYDIIMTKAVKRQETGVADSGCTVFSTEINLVQTWMLFSSFVFQHWLLMRLDTRSKQKKSLELNMRICQWSSSACLEHV